MPNWVANHLIIHGENAVEILHSLLKKRDNENEAGCGYDLDFKTIHMNTSKMRRKCK